MTLKQKIFEIMIKGKRYNQASAILIVFYTLVLILSSINEINQGSQGFLDKLLIACGVYFCLEYTLRLYACDFPDIKDRRQWSFQVFPLIDLIASTSFILSFFTPYNFLFLRIIRLLRTLPVGNDSDVGRSLQTLLNVLSKKKQELFASLILLLVLMTIAACAMYCFEHQQQPQKFGSIPDSLWWAIMTITTVGYGDVYPITIGGKIIAGFFALIGFGFIALPAGIISSAYTEAKKDSKQDDFPHGKEGSLQKKQSPNKTKKGK